MEGRLFIIALWCGFYGLLMRQAFKKGQWVESRWLTALSNGFFWATVGFIAGMLRASYLTTAEFDVENSFKFAIVAFVIGAAWGYSRTRFPEKRDELLQDNLEWADTGFSAILLASVFMFFVVQAFKIPSGSMRMTFVEGDHLFVNKFIYGVPIPLTKKKIFPFTEPKVGDVVIFKFPVKNPEHPHYGKDFIKRVIAVGGQEVQIIDKILFVDGEKVDEPYKQHVEEEIFRPRFRITGEQFQNRWENRNFQGFGGNDLRDNFGPVVVPEGNVMVLGDNRDRSFDSRFWGPLPLDEVKGKAIMVYWPFKRIKIVHKERPVDDSP